MRKNLLLTSFFIFLMASSLLRAEVVITGIVDGDASGGLPKGIELYVHGTEDLSNYTMNRSSNGGTFSSIGSLSGSYSDQFVYLTNNSTAFSTAFGSAGDFANLIVLNGISGNGNDAFQLLDMSSTVIDQVWEANSANYYQDSYAIRNNITGPDGGWVIGNWSTPGNGTLDGVALADHGAAVPFGTYQFVLLSAELLGPQATAKENKIMLDWTTVTETNSAHFSVEKSSDGTTFREMAVLKAAGTSVDPIAYGWTDELPRYGMNYYRLKITDLDGFSTYSDIVVVKFEREFPTFLISPNISAQTISLKISAETDLNADIELFDMNGRKYLQKILPAFQLLETLDISQLAAGIYVIHVRIGNDVYAERFMKF